MDTSSDLLQRSPHLGWNQTYHTDNAVDRSHSSSYSSNSPLEDSRLRPFVGHQDSRSLREEIRRLKEQNLILKTENHTIK